MRSMSDEKLWKDEPLSGHFRIRVVGDSMLPLLQSGDELSVEVAQNIPLRLGDLVLIYRQDHLVTHRLVGRSTQRWITKGDNRLEADQPIDEWAVLGKVVVLKRTDRVMDFRRPRWELANRLLGYVHGGFGRLFEGGFHLVEHTDNPLISPVKRLGKAWLRSMLSMVNWILLLVSR